MHRSTAIRSARRVPNSTDVDPACRDERADPVAPPYYRLIDEGVRDRLGGLHSARLVLDSVDFADIEEMQAAGDWTRAGEYLGERARALEPAMHKVIDAIESSVSVPVVHIGDATSAALAADGIKVAGLLGTRYTMEQSFYTDRFTRNGIDVLVPTDDDRDTVNRIIFDELVRGVIRDESRAEYRDVVQRLVDRGARGIVLGCTEIEMLVGPTDSTVPVYPTTRIHVDAIIQSTL